VVFTTGGDPCVNDPLCMVHASSLNRPACVGYCLPHGLLCYYNTLQAAWHDMRTLAAVTDSRLLYTAGTLKNEKSQKNRLKL